MKIKSKMLVAIAMLFTAAYSLAGVETETDSSDVILAGHYAVAYFTESQPVLGSPDFTAQHDGAV